MMSTACLLHPYKAKNIKLHTLMDQGKSLASLDLYDRVYSILNALECAFHRRNQTYVNYILRNSVYNYTDVLTIAGKYACQKTIDYINKILTDKKQHFPYLSVCLGACAGGHLCLFKKYYAYAQKLEKRLFLEQFVVEAAKGANIHILEFLIEENEKNLKMPLDLEKALRIR